MDTIFVEKLSLILAAHFNIFHADLILRALVDKNVSLETFAEGLLKVYESERLTDDEEFVSEEFVGV